MIDFLSGALFCAYVIASIHFLRFWRRTGDVLFRYFAIAFLLFAVNQAVSSVPRMAVQAAGYELSSARDRLPADSRCDHAEEPAESLALTVRAGRSARPQRAPAGL